MKKYIKYIILVIAIVVCFFGVKILYDRLADDYKPESGLVVENTEVGQVEETGDDNTQADETTQEDEGKVSAMDFTVEDLDGNKISLRSKVGKPIVVNFWASWCSPCKKELPDFQLAYENYGDEVEFMMVNLTDGRNETVEGASGFISSKGYTFPVYYDVNQDAATTYYVMSIPTTYFIDADGNITAYAQGMIDYDTLVKGIGMITE